jgi:Ca2+-binding EF-hand superfamily protein
MSDRMDDGVAEWGTLSKDQAVPYIVNFSMVDVDGDGNITAEEFKAACGKGLVKNTKQ